MSVCPVYSVDHVESHVARGRNVLISMVSKGKIPIERSYKEALYCCILCGRCQSVCPAKISSVAISIKAREELIKKKGLGPVQWLIYRWLLFDRKLLARFIYLISHIPGISSNEAPPLRHLADSFFIFSRFVTIPKISIPFLSDRIRQESPIQKEGKIAVFPGCAFEFFFSYAGEKMIRFLKSAGFDVIYPYGLECCGFPIYSAGDIETAKKIARKNIDILYGYKKIVTGCATCASALKGYKDWFDKDNQYKKKAEYVSSRTKVFSEFLIQEQIRIDANMYPKINVTYHDPCHLRWHQGIYDEPRRIISSIRGIEFTEMDDADMCCGLGGSFGITHRSISLQIQKRKIDSIKRTAAKTVITECPGCMIQLQEGIKRERLPIRVAHLCELL